MIVPVAGGNGVLTGNGDRVIVPVVIGATPKESPLGHKAKGRKGGRRGTVGTEEEGRLPWAEAKGAAMDHDSRQAHHNLLCLHMQVAIELVRAPSPHEADALWADAGTQKCHGN